MRHDQHFAKYRVSITFIDGVSEAPGRPQTKPTGAPPPPVLGETSRAAGVAQTGQLLYPVSFDLWVMTRPGWKVSFSGGVSFSNLTDQKFYIKTDEAGKKTVEEDLNTRDTVRHDIVALANVYFDRQYFRSLMFGVAFGLGDNGSSNPHYFVGPSVVLGRSFIFTAGMAFGSVATLPAGQALHQSPLNGDNTLTSLGSRYQRGFFAGIAFGFVPRESEFKGGFSSATVTAPAAATAPGNGPALAAADLPGDYSNGTLKETVALGPKKDGKDTLTITLDDTSKAKNNNSATLQLDDQVSPSDFRSADGKNEVKFTRDTSGVTMEWLQDGKSILKATKKAATPGGNKL